MRSRAWLKCHISEGQFSGEFALSGKTYDGEGFSLFVPETVVECMGDPSLGPTRGWVEVTVIERQQELVLVKLPTPTLENGATVTVTADQLETNPPVPQRA